MTHSIRRRGLTALSAFALVGTLIATGAAPALADHLVIGNGTGLTIVEGAASGGNAATFTVQMNADPVTDTTFDVTASGATGRVTLSTATLTFTTANWQTPQGLTVTAVDDAIAYPDGNITIDLAISAVSHGSVVIAVDDDDTAGITVTPTAGLETNESGVLAPTFTVVLNSQPTADVVIPITDHVEAETDAVGDILTFTALNWETAQTVTVTGVDDDVDDGNQGFTITLGSPTSDDTTYAAINPDDVTGTNLDNDTAAITVTPTSGLETTEAGGTATFTVVLNSQPTASVVIPITDHDEAETDAVGGILTFTTGDWNSPQTVTVTGIDDSAVDGDQAFTITLGNPTSTDTIYANINPTDVTGTNQDNDVLPPAPAPDPEPTFEDMSGLSEETVQAIETLFQLEITLGTSTDNYSPNQVVSRWQMALFLSRQLTVHGITLPAGDSSGFSDIGGLSQAAQTAIAQIAALDVTSGTSATTYAPDQGVSRWQMALFMTRVLEIVGVELPATTSDDFSDLGGLSAEAQLAIRQLAALEVVSGVGGGEFQPDAPVSRWQMALFIVRTLEAAGITVN